MVKLSYSMRVTQYYKFCIKDLIKNKIKVLAVFPSLFISLIVFALIIILRNELEYGVNANSKILLGGDFEFSSKQKSFSNEKINKIRENYFVTEVIEFTSILRNENEKSKTTRIKVIDDFYPLLGNVETEPINAVEELKKTPNGILINTNIQKNLGIKVGNEIRIQNVSFQVIGIVRSLPDIGSFFLFGDYALINKKYLDDLKLDNLGSFIQYKYKLLKKELKNIKTEDLEDFKDFRKKTPIDVSDDLNKNIENFIFFLSIISASSLLISGIGLKNSLYSFLSSNQKKIAIFKSLGFSSKNIKKLFLIQTVIILIFCTFLAYILSLIILSFYDPAFIKSLNINFSPKFKLEEYVLLQVFSMLIFFIFGNPILEIVEKISVVELFRNSSTNPIIYYSKKMLIKISFLVCIFLGIFCYLNVKPLETFFFFIFFIIIGFFFYLLSKIPIGVIKRILNIKDIVVKISLKNMQTFGNLNSIVTVTMGIGITLLLFIGSLSHNINTELNNTLKTNAPDYFFVGIQENEIKKFSRIIESIDKNSMQRIVPMISARIELINNNEIDKLVTKNNNSYWFVNGERRISWSKKIPFNNTITEGFWWKEKPTNELFLSIDHKVGKDLGLKIGDKITLNIYGKNIEGTIMNFRKINYKDLNINFAILINPEYGSKLPHEFLSSVKFKNKEEVNFVRLFENLPNITYIDLTEFVDKSQTFLRKLFLAGISISSLIVFIGLLVISSAINVVGKLKIYQNLVFKILGLNKTKIFLVIIFESIVIFIPIVIFSLFFSTILSFLFSKYLFGINWYFSPLTFLAISGLFLIALVFTFIFSNNKYLKINTYGFIRND